MTGQMQIAGPFDRFLRGPGWNWYRRFDMRPGDTDFGNGSLVATETVATVGIGAISDRRALRPHVVGEQRWA
jgi:hypothetical protein